MQKVRYKLIGSRGQLPKDCLATEVAATFAKSTCVDFFSHLEKN